MAFFFKLKLNYSLKNARAPLNVFLIPIDLVQYAQNIRAITKGRTILKLVERLQ